MDKEEKILSEIEKTLNSISDLPKLEANPFLFTRIKAQMQKNNILPGSKVKTDFILKPVTLIVILLINIITIAFYLGASNNQYSESSALLNSMKNDYTSIQLELDNYNLE